MNRRAISIIPAGKSYERRRLSNRTLFDGELRDLLITFQRRSHSLGFFSADRFAGRVDQFRAHELSLNADGFVGKADKEICSTLVHEQCHVWHLLKTKKPTRYHDRVWSAMMKQVGLYPSNTGMVGGKEVGVQMDHCILPSGQYEQAFAELAATGWQLNLESTLRAGGNKPKTDVSKTKHTCPNCQLNMWGKPSSLICGECGVTMPPAGTINGGDSDAASYA